MPNQTGVIKMVKLTNGQYYSFFDTGALRLNENNILVTGNDYVDNLILNGHLSIVEIDGVPLEESIDNVLVSDSLTGEIKKRSTDYLLEDIGGASYSWDDNNGVLGLKIGRQ